MENKKYTLQIIMLPVVLVVVSVAVITAVHINVLNRHTAFEIATYEESYISEHKSTTRNTVEYVIDSINYSNSTISSRLDEFIKTKVENAVRAAESMYSVNAGKIPDEDIKQSIQQYLSEAEFANEDGYFFAVNLNTDRIIVHENPKLIGYDMGKHRDAKGLNVLALQKQLLSKSKGAFHDMYFTRPTGEGEFNKRVYVSRFEPYNWLIGTGEYYDYIAEISKKEAIKAFNNLTFDEDTSLFIIEIRKPTESGEKMAEMLFNSDNKSLTGKEFKLSGNGSFPNGYDKLYKKAASAEGGAFVEHAAAAAPDNSKKLTYTYFHDDWNWLIGGSFYFDRLNEYIKSKRSELLLLRQDNIRNSITLAFALSVISGLIALFTAKRINETITSFNNKITRMNAELNRRVEEEVQKNRKQEQIIFEQKKLADMGQLLSAISHQWRQPLNVLGLYGQEAASLFEEHDIEPEFRKEFSEVHREMVGFLSRTIDDFRKFFRPDKEKETYELKEIIKSLLYIVDIQFKNHDIEIKTLCRCKKTDHHVKDFLGNPECVNGEYKINGYPGELKQALINILYNAKDAVEDSVAEGVIDKGIVTMQFNFDDDKVEIRISNNGKPISEDVAENIFQPYFTTKDEGKGTGLGLFIAKASIEKNMNGLLYLDRGAEETTFVIILPRAKN